jgi:hypothetical protein
LLALAVALATGDWRPILFVSIVLVLIGWDLIRDWSLAFPERSRFFPSRFQKPTARLSNAQKMVVALVLSLPVLAGVVVAFGQLSATFLAIIVLAYVLPGLRLLWLIWREGWSGMKRDR